MIYPNNKNIKKEDVEICPECHGRGTVDNDTCSSCNGKGIL